MKSNPKTKLRNRRGSKKLGTNPMKSGMKKADMSRVGKTRSKSERKRGRKSY